jgi:hypothetical protein
MLQKGNFRIEKYILVEYYLDIKGRAAPTEIAGSRSAKGEKQAEQEKLPD